MGDAKEKAETKPQDKVWDRVFKTMMQEHPALFVPLINLVFKKQYGRDVPITSINTETYNKDRSKIMSDISFLIEGLTYHFECQYSDDGIMVFRMFEYDFHIALTDAKRTSNFTEFNFPRSCVFYIVPKASMPDRLEMTVNFQNGSHVYNVPVVRLYDYDLDKIEQNGLFLFLPYEILRHVRQVTTEKHIEEYTNEIGSVYSKIIEIIRNAYNDSRIRDDETLTLMGMLKDTAEYKLKDYPQIWKGVSEMLNREYVPRWKIELEQERKKTTEEVTKEVTKEVRKSEAISTIKLMRNEGISEDFIRKFARQKKISMKTVNEILGSDETKEAIHA